MISTVLEYRGYRLGVDAEITLDEYGERITRWDHVDPQPTPDQLAAWSASPEYAAWLLGRARQQRMAEIDARSLELLTGGIEVAAGVRLSSSLAATQNLQDVLLGVLSGRAVLPQAVSTTDGGSYTIADSEDLQRIVSLYQKHKTEILDAGRKARAKVLASESIDEAIAVKDSR